MRQHREPGSHFLLCLNCDRGEWRRGEISGGETCRHCGGGTAERFPLTLALSREDAKLLSYIAQWTHLKADAVAELAIAREFKRVAGDRLRVGKTVPPWVIDWLAKNRELSGNY